MDQQVSKESKSFLSRKRFEDLPVHANTKRALREVFGYTFLSAPQALYMDAALHGTDVFVKAKTGSGKTLGFLIPALERVLNRKDTNSSCDVQGNPIHALIISPSRELADQTHREAKRLTSYHPSIGVQMVIGGTNPAAERTRLQTQKCDILVATPGRLMDHMESLVGFADVLRRCVRVLVLDEADRLLDMGFMPALKRILAALPPYEKRQSLLFTATVPDGVKEIAARFASPNIQFVDAAPLSQSSSEHASHKSIDQAVVIAPTPHVLPILHATLHRIKQTTPDHRIIVFFATARLTAYVAALFRAVPGFQDVLELHSRLSQGQRNRHTQAFASGKCRILFASDIIARGIDFPDVTLVVQVGLTDVQQYEHRVGRTGRAGKRGEALLILADDEQVFSTALQAAKLPVRILTSSSSPSSSPLMREQLQIILSKSVELQRIARQAYTATLGFYAANMKRLGWKPEQVVKNVNDRFLAMGMNDVPSIEARTAAKMHLKGVAGLRIQDSPSSRHVHNRM